MKRCRRCGYVAASPAYGDHYRRWAEGWGRLVDGRVGVVRGLVHAAGGDPGCGGRYRPIRERLLAHGFDPESDLTLDEQGLWRWASEKPALHGEIRHHLLDSSPCVG